VDANLMDASAGHGAYLMATKSTAPGAVARTQAAVNADRSSVFAWHSNANEAAVRSNAGAVDVAANLQSAFSAAGGGMRNLPAGVYRFNTGITSSYTGAGFPPPWQPSDRVSFRGEGQNSTLLWYGGAAGTYAVTFFADQNQGGSGLDSFGGFGLLDYGTTKTRKGIFYQGKSHWTLHDAIIGGFDVGLTLDACIYGKVSKCIIGYGNIGMVLKDVIGYSNPNANSFYDLTFPSNSKAGIKLEACGASNNFYNLNLESNGPSDISVGAGDDTVGGIVGDVYSDFGGVSLTISGGYVEGNCGEADINLRNMSAGGVAIVVIRGVTFNRVSWTHFTKHNIKIRTGPYGGKIKLLLEGCNCWHSEGFRGKLNGVQTGPDQTLDPTNSYIMIEPGAGWVEQIGCDFPVKLLNSHQPLEKFLHGRILSDGTIDEGPAGLYVNHTAGTGLYAIGYSEAYDRARGSIKGYAVTANVCAPSGNSRIQHVDKAAPDAFVVQTAGTIDGTASDADFVFTLVRDI
jgi:hypothetical protein